MLRLSLPVVIFGLSLLGTGCNQRLTPELVRELLDEPKGTITNETMANVTRDLFMADRASAAEGLANFIKGDTSSDSGTSNIAGLSTGVLETAGDVFCVGGLVASAAAFDACAVDGFETGESCKAELTIDSCVLRVGDPGADEDARGKLKFKMQNSVDDAFSRAELGIEFEGWESTHDDGLLDSLAGQIALETSSALDDSSVEVVFASDLDVNLKRKERGFFDDGIEERANFSAGLRFKADQTDDSASGSLEVLAFADTDGGRDESVVIRMAAEGRELDAETAVASAALEVIGENGTFACTWNGSRTAAEGTRDGVKVTSDGECVDEDGETFSFSGEAISD